MALAVAGAGCHVSVTVGAGKAVDNAKAEAALGRATEQLTGVQPSKVDCPQRKIAKGDVFLCTATIGSQTLRLKVTQTDDKGSVSIVPDQAILDVAKARSEIADGITRQTGIPVQVDCGADPILVRDVGGTFDCQAVGVDGVSRRVAVTVTDITGKVDCQLA